RAGGARVGLGRGRDRVRRPGVDRRPGRPAGQRGGRGRAGRGPGGGDPPAARARRPRPPGRGQARHTGRARRPGPTRRRGSHRRRSRRRCAGGAAVSGSGDRLPRLLALLPYLLAHPGVRVGEAADDFGVPEPQLRRDLQLLWMCGLPGHGPGDLIDLSFEGDTVSVGHDAGLARPLRLTTDEALALVVALRTLADEPRLTDRGAVERALAKVEAAAGVAVAVEPTDRVLAQLRGALDQGRAVHLTYYVAARDETTERDVDPV